MGKFKERTRTVYGKYINKYIYKNNIETFPQTRNSLRNHRKNENHYDELV